MMDPLPIQAKPDKTEIAKDTENTIREYKQIKNALFMSFYSPKPEHKENIKELYMVLLEYIHKLLDYGLVDNINQEERILQLQVMIAKSQGSLGCGEEQIEDLRRLCSWLDRVIQRPYLSTAHPIIDI